MLALYWNRYKSHSKYTYMNIPEMPPEPKTFMVRITHSQASLKSAADIAHQIRNPRSDPNFDRIRIGGFAPRTYAVPPLQ